MIKKIAKLFCYLLLFTVIGSSAFAASRKKVESEPMPNWVQLPTAEYPDADFITYVGYGPDRNAAEAAALNGLSSIFGQSVKSTTNASQRMEEARKNGSIATNQTRGFSQDILRTVDVDNLIGVEIKDYWYSEDEGSWYAIAVMNKEQTLGIYKDMMAKNKGAIDNLLSIAKKDLYSLEAYCAYDFAQEIALENKHNLEKVFVIDYKTAPLYEQYVVSPDDLGAEKLAISSKIPIAVVIDGDDGTYGSVILDALEEFGFKGSLGGNVRYMVTGEVSFEEEESSDGRTTKVHYDFEAFMLDTDTDNQLFPINIRGRQSHRTAKQAMLRAEKDIVNKLEKTFVDSLNKYLSSYNIR